MKNKNILYLLTFAAMLMIQSCSLFEYDAIDLPDETLSGKIVDQDGEPIQVEFGGGARIVLMDYSTHENPEPQYLTVKSDGTFINTKIFKGTYTAIAQGPFVPTDSNTIEDCYVSGKKEINYSVEPYLKLEWIGEPTINSEGSITVKFKLDRGTDNVDYHNDLQDVRLFISTTKYVGNSDKLNLQSPTVSGDAATAMVGKENTLTTSVVAADPLDEGRPYYLRVGARLNYTGEWGSNSYCYTPAVRVVFKTE